MNDIYNVTEMSDVDIRKRTQAGIAIYSFLLNETKNMTEEIFGKPKSYYDQEKERVMLVAKDVFEKCIKREDVERYANSLPSIEEEDATMQIEGREIKRKNKLSSTPEDVKAINTHEEECVTG